MGWCRHHRGYDGDHCGAVGDSDTLDHEAGGFCSIKGVSQLADAVKEVDTGLVVVDTPSGAGLALIPVNDGIEK